MDVDQPQSPSQHAADDDWLDDDTPYASSSSSALPSAHQQSASHQAGTSDREWVTLNERYTNDGYREGITSGKLSTLQSGFDQGYLLSSVPARRLGSLRGSAASLLALLLLPPPKSARASVVPQLSLASEDKAALVEEARELVRDLGRVRMLDVVGRDLEAEKHAREHGEVEGSGEGGKQMEWQEGERKEMDELESMMEGFGAGEKKVEAKTEGEVMDLGGVEARLAELTRRVGLGLSSSSSSSSEAIST